MHRAPHARLRVPRHGHDAIGIYARAIENQANNADKQQQANVRCSCLIHLWAKVCAPFGHQRSEPRADLQLQ